jgi:LacI family transcriptional regulator
MELPPTEVGARLAAMVLARMGGSDSRELSAVLDLRQMPRGSSGEA